MEEPQVVILDDVTISPSTSTSDNKGKKNNDFTDHCDCDAIIVDTMANSIATLDSNCLVALGTTLCLSTTTSSTTADGDCNGNNNNNDHDLLIAKLMMMGTTPIATTNTDEYAYVYETGKMYYIKKRMTMKIITTITITFFSVNLLLLLLLLPV